MEIQRRNNKHLEIVLNARTPDGQKQEIADLDHVIRNWTDKCGEAQTCAITLVEPPEQPGQLAALAQKRISLLEKAYEVSIDFSTAPSSKEALDSHEAGVKRGHLKDLIMLAAVDGQFIEEEEQIILNIGRKMGLSDRQINSIYNESVLNPEAIESPPPKDAQQRLKYLADLCLVILADGKIHDWESVLIFPLAVRMGFDASDVTQMLKDMKKSQ